MIYSETQPNQTNHYYGIVKLLNTNVYTYKCNCEIGRLKCINKCTKNKAEQLVLLTPFLKLFRKRIQFLSVLIL